MLAGFATAHGTRLIRRIALKDINSGGAETKKEPFGFVDGISQPVIAGTYKAMRNPDPIHLVQPGEFVLGYPDNNGNIVTGPTARAAGTAPAVTTRRQDIGRNGTYLVIRELEQDVASFSAYCADQARRLQPRLAAPYQVTPEFIAAKLMGRWQDGSSLVRNPYMPESAEAKPGATEPDRSDDNDFLFGRDDAQGLRCPFGAHVRRANPRDSFNPASPDQIAISNRHRLLRVGRQFLPEPGNDPGLFFMGLCGDIERQFEFVQQSWLKGSSFHDLSCEKDPVLCAGERDARGMCVPSSNGPIRLAPMPSVVTVRGGGYFFLPGRQLIDLLRAP